MAFDDRLYDPIVSPDHRFHVYSSVNSYIAPYSSDTHGGELITEFNQRASLNTLLARTVDLSTYSDTVAAAINDFVGEPTEIDSTTGETVNSGPGLNSFRNALMRDRDNWHFVSYASDARSVDDFKLSIDNATGKLTVAAGHALVYGYFIQGSEVLLEKSDIISVSEIADVAGTTGQNPDNPCITKFIKLAVEYTAPESSRHDERLIPPLNGVYQGAAIVVNDELPYGNELLLGTVTCDSKGRFLLVQNPYKTRMIPLSGVQGAEDYSDLISSPDDGHIYGIKHGEPGNLIDIDKWIWIAFGSNLGKLLRSMSTNADTAGNANDEPTRGVIVSDHTPYTEDDPVVDEFNCLQRIDAKTGNSFARVSWHQAQTPPRMGADLIDHRALYFQYAMAGATGSSLQFDKKVPTKDGTVAKPFYDTNSYPCLNGLNGTDGIMTYQQLAMLELVFDDYIHRQADGYARGRQFGPFLTLSDAAMWFENHKPSVRLGDYFWVINDVGEAGGVEATNSSSGYELRNIVTNYGTVAGSVSGTVKQSKLEVKVSGSVNGEATDEESEVTFPVSGEVNGIAQGTVNATVSGTCTGTLDSFTQNVSGRYVCRVYKPVEAGGTGRWDFAHGVMLDEKKISGSWGSNTLQPGIRPGSLLIVPAQGHPVESDTGDIQDPIADNKYGALIADGNTVGHIDYATGVITGVYNQSTATVSYLIDDSEGDYVILDPEGDYQSFIDTSSETHNTPQNVLFALESVERGFAVPATSTTYGVVKAGSGSQPYDVIVDPTTQRLRITDVLVNLIKGGGFTSYPYAEITISPGVNLESYCYRRYADGVVFKLEGNASEWRAMLDTTGTLAHLRGKVTLDFSEVIEDGKRSDGLLLNLVDIDYVILKGDNLQTTTHISTQTLLFGLDHCVVDKYFFTNIGKWKYSSFISGGNTLDLDLPWMLVSDLFTNSSARASSLFCKFSSITMGEEGICSAMMDLWVKDNGWQDFSGNIDRVWSSAGYIKYPPLFFEHNKDAEGAELSSIDRTTIQYIPDNLNMKVSGTSGVHQSYDDNNSEYIPSGNLLVNLNWEYNGNPTSASTPGGKMFLNLYMKNSSPDVTKQNFSNLRFRANVQVIRLDNNDMSDFIPYEELYEPIPTSL